MDFQEIVVKDSPGLCRCCLSEGCYKELGAEYTWLNETEVYADMLLDCFDISITQHVEGPNGPNRLICEVCIMRLRDACEFKKQVLESEKKFVDMVAKGEFTKTVLAYKDPVKVELTTGAAEMNIEYLEDSDLDNDDLPERIEIETTHDDEDLTVSMLPAKRGRPKKTVTKSEKTVSKKGPKVEQKAMTSKDALIVDVKKLLTLVIHCSTMMPFRWSSGRYTCFYCNLVFTESSKLKIHTTTAHRNAKLQSLNKITSWKRLKLDVSSAHCKICGDSVEDLDDFLNHLTRSHESIAFNRQASERFACFKLADEMLPCPECEETFRFFGPLLVHFYRNHGKSKTYICEICGLTFVDKSNWSSHLKTVHSGSRTKAKHIVCPKCPQVFRTNYSRSRHLAVDHDVRSAQYVCNECGFMFVYKNRLVRHQLCVHRKEKGCRCTVCGFVTFDKEALKRHMIRHTDEKPYECEYCSKTFQRKKYLIVHTRIHTNEKPYACQFCEKAFTQVSSLNLHLKNHHPDKS